MTLSPHLDDETISALHDGELAAGDDAAARVHVDACETCRARLESFADVSAAVGAAIPGSALQAADERRESVVAAALDTSPSTTAPRHGRNWRPVLAIAAVLVVLVLAVPLVRVLDSGDDTSQTAAGSGKTSLESAVGPLADLGAVDESSLATVVGEQVGAAATFARPAPTATDDAERSAGGDGAPAAGDGAPAAAAEGTGDTVTADRARACAPGLDAEGESILVARATWEDRPAAVLAYRSGDDVTAYVVNPPDCRILHFVRFRAPS